MSKRNVDLKKGKCVSSKLTVNQHSSAKSVVFQVAIQTLKDQDIKKYNFARGFVWVQNQVADTEGGTQAEGV
jgi:hypothetical protein